MSSLTQHQQLGRLVEALDADSKCCAEHGTAGITLFLHETVN